MQVVFTRREDNGTVAEYVRPDGVRLRLHSYDRTGQVPHDAAHLVVERACRLEHGLWGALTAGALFDSVEVVEGRTRHDHRAKSTGLRRTYARELRLSEQLVGAVLSCLSDGRDLPQRIAAAWVLYGRTVPAGLAPAGAQALAELRALRARWARLHTGDAFDLHWPAAPVQRRTRTPRRGPEGRS
ncbi:MAG: hypothetical protein ACT4QF_16675 [Sporichthyaceae bacterium]